MEKELESKIFMFDNYQEKDQMEKDIKEYIRKLKRIYNDAIVTREFYKGKNVLVRATKITISSIKKDKIVKENQLEKEEIRIKEKGINGLGENIPRVENERAKKEKTRGGEGRERC